MWPKLHCLSVTVALVVSLWVKSPFPFVGLAIVSAAGSRRRAAPGPFPTMTTARFAALLGALLLAPMGWTWALAVWLYGVSGFVDRGDAGRAADHWALSFVSLSAGLVLETWWVLLPGIAPHLVTLVAHATRSDPLVRFRIRSHGFMLGMAATLGLVFVLPKYPALRTVATVAIASVGIFVRELLVFAPRLESAVSSAWRSQRTRFWGLVFALSALTFLPRFVASYGRTHLLPFFPYRHAYSAFRLDWQSVVQYPIAIFWSRANHDVFRLSLDVLLLCTLVTVSARINRLRWMARVFAAVSFVLLWVFLAYDTVLNEAFARPSVLGDDRHVLLSGLHLISDLSSLPTVIVALGLLLVVGVFGFAVERVLLLLQRLADGFSFRWLAVVFLYAGVSFWLQGPDHSNAVVQLHSASVVGNVRRSARLTERREKIRSRLRRQLSATSLRAKPDVYLFVIESYGNVLATDNELSPFGTELIASAERKLLANGFHARSTSSEVPVYGGWSWISVDNLITGLPIRYQSTHLELVEGKFTPEDWRGADNLVQFLASHGYTTASLQPGNRYRLGLHRAHLFGVDVQLEGPDLHYTGEEFGWAGTPDQYTLGFAQAQVFDAVDAPLFVFMETVASHAPYHRTPPFVGDWRDLNGSKGRWQELAIQPTLIEAPDGDAPKFRYLRTMVYAWSTLVDFLAEHVKDDAIVIITSDHQPVLGPRPPGDVFSVPLHVVSKSAEVVESIGRGFSAEGLTLRGAGTMQHADLYPMLVEHLTESD